MTCQTCQQQITPQEQQAFNGRCENCYADGQRFLFYRKKPVLGPENVVKKTRKEKKPCGPSTS